MDLSPSASEADIFQFSGSGFGLDEAAPQCAEELPDDEGDGRVLTPTSNRPPAWRDLLGGFSELPIILGGNTRFGFYELKPMLEYVYFWQLTRAEIDDLLRDKRVTERSEVVLAKMDGIDSPVICIDPSVLCRVVNRVDRRLGLLPSVARSSRALALKGAIREGSSVIVVPAAKSACQRSYERRQARKAVDEQAQ